jgi:hypothetical protein
MEDIYLQFASEIGKNDRNIVLLRPSLTANMLRLGRCQSVKKKNRTHIERFFFLYQFRVVLPMTYKFVRWLYPLQKASTFDYKIFLG